MERQEKKSLSNIFFAIFAGTAIGFVLIKEYLAPISPWLSLVGGLIGGLSAYVLNDWRGAIAAVPKAWHATQETLSAEFHKTINSFNGIYWPVPILHGLELGLLVMNSFTGIAITAMIATNTYEWAAVINGTIIILFLSISFMAIAFLSTIAEKPPLAYSPEEKQHWKDYCNDQMKVVIFLLPPVLIVRATSFIVMKALPFVLVTMVPNLLKVICFFTFKFFVLIHNEDRLISAVDAFIFALLAYATGALSNSWIAGSVLLHITVFATAGGIFGIGNKLYVKPVMEAVLIRIEKTWETPSES